MSVKAPTIAFFGATGGCCNSALVNALRGGHHVVALARTPSKLSALLQTQGISTATQTEQLEIIAGDALDKAAVKKTITANRPNHLVKYIVSGIGGTPNFNWNWSKPAQCFTIDNPTVCADAAKTLLAALSDVYTENPDLKSHKPRLTFVSTTGISRGPEDVPFGMRKLYHSVLAEPHLDKKAMEDLYRGNVEGKDDHGPLLAGFVGVRPTLLKGGIAADTGAGLSKIRAGREAKPATGFSISRADVGQWIYVNTLDENKRVSWENEMASLTS